MIKEKKLSKTLVSIFLILATCFSIVFVANQVSKTSKDTNLSLSAVSDISDSSVTPLSLTETYGIIDGIGGSGSGKDTDPYKESPWNGRIKSQNQFDTLPGSTVCNIEVNVDPRDSIFGDDVIIEFKSFSQTPPLGIKKALPIGLFNATITFWSSSKGEITKKTDNCYDKSSKGYTINSGEHDIYKVHVNVYFSYKGTGHNLYYEFT